MEEAKQGVAWVGGSEEAEAGRESQLRWELPAHSFTESSQGRPQFREEEAESLIRRDEASHVLSR